MDNSYHIIKSRAALLFAMENLPLSLVQMCSLRIVEKLSGQTGMYAGLCEEDDEEIIAAVEEYIGDRAPKDLIERILKETDSNVDNGMNYPDFSFLLFLQSKRTEDDLDNLWDGYRGRTSFEYRLFDDDTKISTEKMSEYLDEHIQYFEKLYFRCKETKEFWLKWFGRQTLERFDEYCEKPRYKVLKEHRPKLLRHWGFEE